tara:strand:- start:952 stop:1809 length:858 start_codon:yes stop_codon:yes gene_type:complete
MTQNQDNTRSIYIDRDGVNLHALDWGGSGPPIFLIHGSRRTAHSWNAVSRRIRSKFRVIALDMLGHGRSDAPKTGYMTKDRASDTQYMINQIIGDEKHYLMAHSLGGASTAIYAAKNFDRILGMMLIEPVMQGPEHYVRVGILDDELNEIQGRGRRNTWNNLEELKQRLMANSMTKVWTEEVLKDVLERETLIHEDGKAEAMWHLNSYNIGEMQKDEFSLIDNAPDITIPVSIMVAGDNSILKTHLIPFSERLPNANLSVYENLGHAIYMEDPDLVAKEAIKMIN